MLWVEWWNVPPRNAMKVWTLGRWNVNYEMKPVRARKMVDLKGRFAWIDE